MTWKRAGAIIYFFGFHFGSGVEVSWFMLDRYGEEIARLQLAETMARKALDAVKPGLGGAVTSDLKVRVSPFVRVRIIFADVPATEPPRHSR